MEKQLATKGMLSQVLGAHMSLGEHIHGHY